MHQLDLFQHAPRHYYEALRRLGRLDLVGCRAALDRHRSSSPEGPSPGPVEEAAGWLGARLPSSGADFEAFGRSAWSVCLSVKRGAAPALLAPEGGAGEEVAAKIADQAVRRMGEAGVAPNQPLLPGLPWGVLGLFAGRPSLARESLLSYLAGAEPCALACLVLGQACWLLGRADEALRAFREGCGLDPGGDVWPWSQGPVNALREGFAGDPVFSGEWWAVGAYLLGGFPAYEQAPRELVTRRWQRFLRDREAWERGGLTPPVLFFGGLFLSEQGPSLAVSEVAAVRNVLRSLHPDAYEMHREILSERGALPPGAGRSYFAW